ncbi:J domain-containing protein [Oculatella sp. LEGE 06141]|uniref:J domain-containing protein n=1 Tax=Oculatella sp. LEGE 06141 TaxID=1828648 RepID=UPI00187E2674|nr:J domain-containing protein [Oculatella sp. LEGE 06141]MBE9178738.1 J domain-containing protein [Oculatella sp. LEGE 06141]
MLTLVLALNLLALEAPFELIQLKDAYRREIKKWHPDLNPHRLEKATEHCQDLNAAYDLLEATLAANNKQQSPLWAEWMNKKLPEWEREFKDLWRNAYWKTALGENKPDSGLHYSTCIANFKRAAIEPRPEWFKGCLFADTPESRTQYREHLLKIAPNQKLREEWARKYFALEFGESCWVFYLPASRALLTGGANVA